MNRRKHVSFLRGNTSRASLALYAHTHTDVVRPGRIMEILPRPYRLLSDNLI